jgi:hypothetical protein
VEAAGGKGPAHDPWFRLLEAPAWCLLRAMVASAFRAEVAFVGRGVGVGDGVVEVGVDGLCVAAGGVAGVGAGTDEVGELAAGGVAVLGVAVVALAASDGLGMI